MLIIITGISLYDYNPNFSIGASSDHILGCEEYAITSQRYNYDKILY